MNAAAGPKKIPFANDRFGIPQKGAKMVRESCQGKKIQERTMNNRGTCVSSKLLQRACDNNQKGRNTPGKRHIYPLHVIGDGDSLHHHQEEIDGEAHNPENRGEEPKDQENSLSSTGCGDIGSG